MNNLKVVVTMAFLAFFSTSLFAYEINEHRSWGDEIKCESGNLHEIKQVDGKWLNPVTEEGFETMEEAATASCQE